MSVRTRRRRLAVVLVGLSAVGLSKAGAFDGVLFTADMAKASQQAATRPPLPRPGSPVRPATCDTNNHTPASRLAGATVYETAVAVTRAAFPAGSHPRTVYLASGSSWVASVAAGPAAAASGAVLPTARDTVPEAILDEVRRLAPERVVVLGSAAQVSEAAEHSVDGVAGQVERLDVADAPALSLALANDGFRADGARTAYLASSASFGEALVAAAAAGANDGPLLLVDQAATNLTDDARHALDDLGVKEVTIIGAAAQVPVGVEADLRSRVGAVTRIAGADASDTSVRVAKAAFSATARGTAYLASGSAWTEACPSQRSLVTRGDRSMSRRPTASPRRCASTSWRARRRRSPCSAEFRRCGASWVGSSRAAPRPRPRASGSSSTRSGR